jgi:hypothetical protein
LNYFRILLTGIFSIIFLANCHRTTELPQNVEADYIKYDVHYLEDKAGDIPTKVLPSSMEAFYTKHFVLTRIEGFFGQFSLIQIASLKNREVTTLLNFFGNKVYYVGAGRELPAGVKAIPGLQLNYTQDTINIAGLTSYRIEVASEDSEYDIFCTKEIKVRRPNITTPYSMVNYALSDFRIQLSYLKMHLICVEYEKRMIESEAFTIPESYKRVSRNAMEEIINSLFTKD